jgi:predicted AAA+ superfamily ATPase
MTVIKRLLNIELPDGQSCFLWGARKTGKSTFLRGHFLNALYVDLLDAQVYQSYLSYPGRLAEHVRAHPEKSVIILDEVQKIPFLLDEVHRMIEKYKDKSFILCGSSARRLKETGANLLGGRAWRYVFVPLCYPELHTLDWQKIFTHGLIPSHYLEENSVKRSLSAYLFDYVLPEVQFEANLRKRDNFARFLDMLGFSGGELINYSNIARDCGVDAKTVRTYFEILEDMYLGYYLRPYQTRDTRQSIQQMPKFYLFDVGLASYLRRFDFKDMTGSEAGKSFEHYVFLELMAYKLLKNIRDDIYFWRTKEGYEVDFIFQNHAFEVKITQSFRKSDIQGLLAFSKNNTHQLHIISLEPRKRILSIEQKEITIWPIQEFLDVFWSGDFIQ